ncbi:S8 family peptidase [Cohnella phaseoli]|uniref:Subtilase family protein n=1 Tax=Cohnella phaseoli TaxID=456490 RepID=A0A3D9HU70_9BACL|nr:S8 family peptidase [Cohnella phaseoli]RED52921.1 subtilase family protein [Cohnella phaseoli]
MNRSEIANEICAFPGPPTIDDQRYIVRFLDSRDFERFLLEGRSGELREEAADRDIRPLPLIQAVSCPAKEAAQIILALGDKAVWEIDAPVRASALSKGAIVTDKGIPWGVRRIQAPQAWGKTTGYRVKVGVIDTGVDYGHPDLKHSLERGINLLSRMSLPQDDNGHGTHIAGTIAAANELQGMIGVAPRSMIYPVKAFDHNGTAFVSDIVLGIEWCVRNHMDVVNMSFGMRTRSRSLLSAVNYAYHSGVLIVASSGNEGRIGEIDYPAGFSRTIAVGATNRTGRIAKFTNRNSLIDIFAPGDRIMSSWLRGKHREMSGTSMATSHVTGAIALLLSLRPGLPPSQIKSIVKNAAVPLRNAKAPRTAGELNVTRILSAADQL